MFPLADCLPETDFSRCKELIKDKTANQSDHVVVQLNINIDQNENLISSNKADIARFWLQSTTICYATIIHLMDIYT